MRYIIAIILTCASFQNVIGQIWYSIPTDSIIYSGVENRIRILNYKNNFETVELSFDKGDVTKVNDSCFNIYTPITKDPTGQFIIYNNKIKTDSIRVKIKKLVIESYIACNGVNYRLDTTLEKETLINCDSIFIKCNVPKTYFTVIYYKFGTDRSNKIISNYNNQLNPESINLINECKSGDVIYFREVFTQGGVDDRIFHYKIKIK
jgi:hypothetical protein